MVRYTVEIRKVPKVNVEVDRKVRETINHDTGKRW
jgi:hypothetical protein